MITFRKHHNVCHSTKSTFFKWGGGNRWLVSQVSYWVHKTCRGLRNSRHFGRTLHILWFVLLYCHGYNLSSLCIFNVFKVHQFSASVLDVLSKHVSWHGSCHPKHKSTIKIATATNPSKCEEDDTLLNGTVYVATVRNPHWGMGWPSPHDTRHMLVNCAFCRLAKALQAGTSCGHPQRFEDVWCCLLVGKQAFSSWCWSCQILNPKSS